MKIFYLITAVLFLSFIGCSSTYKVSDFSSKDKFYEDFNKSVKDKNVNINLTNDSTYTFNNGVELNNDTLYSIGYKILSQYRKIALPDINNINYTSLDYKSGDILLKDNKILKAEKIKIISDSVEFMELKTIITRDNISNITKVRKVIYYKHWLGIIPGIISGFLISFVIAELGDAFSTHVDSGIFATGAANVEGVPVGTIAGGVIGWFIGYTYTYQFNP